MVEGLLLQDGTRLFDLQHERRFLALARVDWQACSVIRVALVSLRKLVTMSWAAGPVCAGHIGSSRNQDTQRDSFAVGRVCGYTSCGTAASRPVLRGGMPLGCTFASGISLHESTATNHIAAVRVRCCCWRSRAIRRWQCAAARAEYGGPLCGGRSGGAAARAALGVCPVAGNWAHPQDAGTPYLHRPQHPG